MPEVEFSRLLSDLTTTARTLNKASDSLNEVLTACEDTLRRLNVGLEVWLDDDPISWNASTEEGHDEAIELGFAAVHDEWQLVLRRALYGPDAEGKLTVRSVWNVKPLSDGSRKQRIEAVKRLPQLIEAIKQEAEAAVKAIEAAKNLLK